MNQYRALHIATLAAALSLASAATAAQRSLGEFRAWSAVRYGSANAPVCMMWSAPTREQGKYTRRGDVYAFVTRRASAKGGDRVGFEAGYPFADASTVTVQVDGSRFRLETTGSTAFAASPTIGKQLVAAMRAGRKMVVKGTSRRGTATRDTYSLLGFSAAHRAIDRACR